MGYFVPSGYGYRSRRHSLSSLSPLAVSDVHLAQRDSLYRRETLNLGLKAAIVQNDTARTVSHPRLATSLPR